MSDPGPIVSSEPAAAKVAVSLVNLESDKGASASTATAVESSMPTPTKHESLLETPAQAERVPTSWLWMNKYDQLIVGVFVAVFLVLCGYHWATLGGWGMRPIELDRLPARQYDFRIDINSASWVEWTQIEGIGEATAQKIIADRKANGPFRSAKDLLRVKGIGPKTLEKMRPFLREPSEHDLPEKANP